jgi:hypothetical protein
MSDCHSIQQCQLLLNDQEFPASVFKCPTFQLTDPASQHTFIPPNHGSSSTHSTSTSEDRRSIGLPSDEVPPRAKIELIYQLDCWIKASDLSLPSPKYIPMRRDLGRYFEQSETAAVLLLPHGVSNQAALSGHSQGTTFEHQLDNEYETE